MKKILIIVAAMAVFTTSAFAKTWTNNVGFGFTLPISQQTVKNGDTDEKFKQVGYGLDAFYLGIHKNGFCVKGDFAFGVTTTKSDVFGSDVVDEGVFVNFALGPGYAFVNDKRFTLALTGMLGADITSYSYTTKILSTTTDVETTSVTFALGADLYSSVRVGSSFGFYFDLGFYFLPGGEFERKVTTNGNTTKTTWDINSGVRFTPTLGFSWKF
ncbi:MAG: hypothetical protein K5873_08735 [Treponema sp.]|nr:hypothetical protein [Treponema sp.]